MAYQASSSPAGLTRLARCGAVAGRGEEGGLQHRLPSAGLLIGTSIDVPAVITAGASAPFSSETIGLAASSVTRPSREPPVRPSVKFATSTL
eukprot:7017154-Prymnesium_polylepis.1